MRTDCGVPDHEWVRCRGCPQPVDRPCPCAGGVCCQREADEIERGDPDAERPRRAGAPATGLAARPLADKRPYERKDVQVMAMNEQQKRELNKVIT